MQNLLHFLALLSDLLVTKSSYATTIYNLRKYFLAEDLSLKLLMQVEMKIRCKKEGYGLKM